MTGDYWAFKFLLRSVDEKHLMHFESLKFQWRMCGRAGQKVYQVACLHGDRGDSELTKVLDNGRFLGLFQSIGNSFTVTTVVLYGHFTPRSGLGRLGAYGLGGLGA